MEKTTQEKEVLDYLRKIGSITSWEAIVEFGATRLSAIIYNLRKKGYNIETNDVIVKNRYGNENSKLIL